MAQTNNNNNQQLYDQMLNEINQEIEDMQEAERQMLAQGLSLADYSLPVAASTVRRDRIVKEQAAKQERLPKTTIGGEVVSPGDELPFTPPNDVMETSPYRRRSESREHANVASRQGKEEQVRQPMEQDIFIKNLPQSGEKGLVAGERIKYDPSMLEGNPEIQKFVEKYGDPEFVVQMTNYDQKVDDKPEMFLQALPTKAQIKAGEPKLSDYSKYSNKHALYNADLKRYREGKPILPLH